MRTQLPKWLKAGLGALGVTGLLASGIGMYYTAAPAAHAAHVTHSAMYYTGGSAQPGMYYD